MKSLKHLFNLFYPAICLCCEDTLQEQETLICLSCRMDLPLIDNKDFKDNLIDKIFQGRVPVQYSGSFLYFRKNGKVKKLIHHLKYKGKQEVGTFLGDWFGQQLANANTLKDIDVIVPVPLHQKKLRKRGYNQLTTFGKALSKNLNTPLNSNILLRVNNSKTQTFKTRFDRFQSKNTKFQVANHKEISNKHLLLIDDVVTTGSTLEACCKELLKGKNVSISILTMAYTE